jgi:hypothetical protein
VDRNVGVENLLPAFPGSKAPPDVLPHVGCGLRLMDRHLLGEATGCDQHRLERPSLPLDVSRGQGLGQGSSGSDRNEQGQH